MTLPLSFQNQMQAILGSEYEAFVQSLATASPTSIRLNPFKTYSSEGELVPWCPEAFYLPKRPEFSKDPLWHSGAYYVQEAGSMFIGHVLQQLTPLFEKPIVLDLCAAPGGKTTHLASLLYNKGLLVSNEVVKSRVHILQENVCKWGLNNVVITHNDPSHFSKIENAFDILVVDAPCSGEGLFRKQPEAVNEWSEKAVEFCAHRQQRVLEDIWPSLKPGGFLVYSTCTYNKKENEENAQWLCDQYATSPFSLEIDPSWNVAVENHSNFQSFRFYPHKTQSEGFFFTVIQKGEEGYKDPNLFVKRPYFHRLSKEEKPLVEDWIDLENALFMRQPNGIVNVLPAELYEETEYFAQKLKVIYCGTEIAEIKGKDMNPMQGLANLVGLRKEAFQTVEVDTETALRYLAKQDIGLDCETGTNLLLYQGSPLGWLKKMPNRINNYYPQEWRLRNL